MIPLKCPLFRVSRSWRLSFSKEKEKVKTSAVREKTSAVYWRPSRVRVSQCNAHRSNAYTSILRGTGTHPPIGPWTGNRSRRGGRDRPTGCAWPRTAGRPRTPATRRLPRTPWPRRTRWARTAASRRCSPRKWTRSRSRPSRRPDRRSRWWLAWGLCTVSAKPWWRAEVWERDARDGRDSNAKHERVRSRERTAKRIE